MAQVFGAFEFVDGVFLRRTVATGEVTFGRSDIDFTIVLKRPLTGKGEPERLLALNRCRRMLKVCIPILGECDLGTADELIRSYRADTLRASVDRRTALTVYGRPLDIPELPVTTADALSWMTIWFAYFLPLAMRQGSRRNMRKFALEMWNAARTATGDIEEPYPSRGLAESAWRDAEGAAFPLGRRDGVEHLFGVCCRIISEVHGRFCAPLEKIDGPLIHRGGRLPWVLVPGSGERLPPEVRQPSAFAGSPEALDLFMRYWDPSRYRRLPEELKQLGIKQPGYQRWLAYCRRVATNPRLLRVHGFITNPKDSVYAMELIGPGREAARQLRAGQIPVWTGKPDVKLRDDPPSVGEYYRQWFPRLYEQLEEAWDDLDACGDQLPDPAAISNDGGGG